MEHLIERPMPYSRCTDDELLSCLSQDEKQAFEELYSRYWKRLYVVAANRLANVHDAEEIVQDIFTSLWIRRNDVEISEGGLGKYLTVSVKYRVIKTLGKYAVRQNYVQSRDQASLIDDSTQEWLAFEELKEELAKYVELLPDKCRLVYKMSRHLGYSQKQIANELQLSEKTVEAHLGKASKILRSKLAGLLVTLL